MTHKSTWKKFERAVAKFFGTCRKALSGGAGQEGQTKSDSHHPKLYIECKLRKKMAIWSLFDDTKKKASSEGKLPVIATKQKGKHGFLITVHSSDLEEFINRYCVYLADKEHEEYHG